MQHVFRATRMGWEKKREGIHFDASVYSEAEARAQFKPVACVSERGYPYTAYEYDGIRYHDFEYLGIYPDDKMPRNDLDYVDSLIERLKKRKK